MKSKRKRIFITLSCGITLLCVFAFIYGIGEKPPIAIYTTSSGKEYNILKIYDLKFMDTGEKMLAVHYLSEGPNNEAIRSREFEDVYEFVANNISLDKYDLVGLEAVDKPEKQFGFSVSQGYRDNRPVSEVLKLVKSEE